MFEKIQFPWLNKQLKYLQKKKPTTVNKSIKKKNHTRAYLYYQTTLS